MKKSSKKIKVIRKEKYDDDDSSTSSLDDDDELFDDDDLDGLDDDLDDDSDDDDDDDDGGSDDDDDDGRDGDGDGDDNPPLGGGGIGNVEEPLIDEKKKKQFEKERDDILNDLPKEYKDRFGQIVYAKFTKNWIAPVLVMSPYTIWPGEIREKWMNMYRKLKDSDRLEHLSYIVYWYGSFEDVSAAFSFVKTEEFLDKEKGLAGFRKLQDSVRKKQESRKKLAKKDDIVLVAEDEMKEDEKKEPAQRRGKLDPLYFQEDYEYYPDDIQDESDEESKKKKKSVKKSSKKNATKSNDTKKTKKSETKNVKKKIKMKKTLDDEMSDEESTPSSVNKKSKLKKLKKKKKSAKQDSEDFDVEDAGDDSHISKKKKTIKLEEDSNGEVDDKIPIPKKKKKIKQESENDLYLVDDGPIPKKKKKVKTEEESDGVGANGNLPIPKKKKKKRAKDEDGDGMVIDDEGPIPPAKKAKAGENTSDGKGSKILPSENGEKESPKEEKMSAYDEYMIALEEDKVSSDEDDDDYGDSGDERELFDDNFAAGDVEEKELNESNQKKKRKKSDGPNSSGVKKRLVKKSKVVKKASNDVEPELPKKAKHNTPENEQENFEVCEENYLELLNRWEKSIAKADPELLEVVYDRLLGCIKEFTAPFIEVYGLSDLLKQSKAILNNSKRKEVLSLFKNVYTEKKNKVPKGFKPIKQSEREEKEKYRKKAEGKKKTDEEGAKIPTRTTTDDIPSKNDSSFVAAEISKDIDSARRKSTSDLIASNGSESRKELGKKKKFSLGNLMKSTSSSQFETNFTEPVSRTGSSDDLVEKVNENKGPPWTAIDASIKSLVSSEGSAEEERQLGRVFLDQAVPFVPPAKNMDNDSIARGLEIATFEYAVNNSESKPVTSSPDGPVTVSNTSGWVTLYWDKIHALIAALSGKGGQEGTLARMISRGDFDKPHDVVKLSDDQLWSSYNGKKLER